MFSCYILLSHSIGTDVWFDNIAVQHYQGNVLEEDHYYPFGLTISSTAAGTTAQLYKYQGKELERSFGIEMYDFDARQVDPQIGRFTGIDPHADRYVSISPFVSMNNNPVNTIDPDGKDARVTINDNVITISSTVHISGGSEQYRADFVKNANAFVGKMEKWGKTRGTYTDDNGKEWTINLEVNYVEVGNQDFEEGDNTMDISKIHEGGRSKMTGGDKWTKEDGWDYNTAGNSGTMRGGKAAIEYGFSVFHETMHLFGLSDRYEENGYVPPQYQSDVMSDRGTNMNQNHWDNWGKAALRENGNFILRHRVDMTGNETMKYLQPENTPTKRGTRR